MPLFEELDFRNLKVTEFIVKPTSIQYVREFVEKCFEKIDIKINWKGKEEEEIGIDNKTGKILVKVNSKYFRPCEVKYLLGDAQKAIKKLDWTREYDTIDNLINSMFYEL